MQHIFYAKEAKPHSKAKAASHEKKGSIAKYRYPAPGEPHAARASFPIRMILSKSLSKSSIVLWEAIDTALHMLSLREIRDSVSIG